MTKNIIAEIKKLITEDKLVLGTKVTLKELKKGALTKIFMASNTPQDVKSDLEHYCKLSGLEVLQTNITNEELGIICKKSFLISVIGQKK